MDWRKGRTRKHCLHGDFGLVMHGHPINKVQDFSRMDVLGQQGWAAALHHADDEGRVLKPVSTNTVNLHAQGPIESSLEFDDACRWPLLRRWSRPSPLSHASMQVERLVALDAFWKLQRLPASRKFTGECFFARSLGDARPFVGLLHLPNLLSLLYQILNLL